MKLRISRILSVFLAAAGMAGCTLLSACWLPDRPTPSGELEERWRGYPDLRKETSAAKTVLKSFSTAAAAGDPDAAASYVAPVVRDRYLEAFRKHPDALPAYAEAMKTATVVYLSDPALVASPSAVSGTSDPVRGAELRTMDLAVRKDGIEYIVRMIQVDGNWYLYII